MQNIASFCEGDDLGQKRWEPRIPAFGPASQLSPRVLVPATARDRQEKRSRTAISALPSLFDNGLLVASRDDKIKAASSLHQAVAPHSARTRGRAGMQLNLNTTVGRTKAQSCEPRLQKLATDAQQTKGLWSALCKGDQTHRLRENPKDEGEAIAHEDRTSKPFCSSELSCSHTQAHLGSAGPVPQMESPRKQVRHLHPSPHRLSCLRASFHLDEKEIATSILQLQRYQNTKEMEERSETENDEVSMFVAKFENCGLASKPVRRSKVAAGIATPDELHHGEDRVGLGDDLGSTASSNEISTCAGVLNFYRWLCGLPPVRLNSARLDICNVVSASLLPRAVPSFQLGPDANDFVNALDKILSSRGNSVCVLHGEASLLTLVEKCLSSTDTIRNETMSPVINIEQYASTMAERVETLNPGALKAPSQSKNLRNKARMTYSNYDDSYIPRPMLFSNDLPEPLGVFKILWDLQPGSSKSCPKRASAPRPHKSAMVVPSKKNCSKALSSIWGDRSGSLAFRRYLLNPALREFGAARRHDTCVLWTGSGTEFESPSLGLKTTPRRVPLLSGPPKRTSGQKIAEHVDSKREPDAKLKPTPRHVTPYEETPAAALGAVCWPPAGIVPLSLVINRNMVWTIMPNSSRFQPTESIRLHAWRVKIEKGANRIPASAAERLSEIVIKDFIVDCSALGEPFCVMFWPDFGQALHGYQLEVELSGLRGDPTTLNFFYEFKSFVQQEFDEHICAAAATFRSFIGDYSFWGQPRDCPEVHIEEIALPVQLSRKSFVLPRVEKPPLLSMISYQEDTFTTKCVDITIVLQSTEAAAIGSELFLVRFSGEEEEVPFGSVVQKLPSSDYFLVRAKLPMSRQRFEIRFLASTKQNPTELKKHPFRYSVTTSKECQSLVALLDDRLLRKFGYAAIDAIGQLYGIFILAPSTRRITVGQCYFLVYVDRAMALSKAMMDHPTDEDKPTSIAAQRKTVLYTKRLSMPEIVVTKPSVVEESRAAPPEVSPPLGRSSVGSSTRQRVTPTIGEVQQRLRDMLENVTKDTAEDIHLDVVLRNGEAIHRLRERSDFPGFFEGLYNFRENDIERTVELFYRFPLVNASAYAPRKLGSWFVCRDQAFPPNF